MSQSTQSVLFFASALSLSLLAGPVTGQVQTQELYGSSTDNNVFGFNVAATPDGTWVVGTGLGEAHVYRYEGASYSLHDVLDALPTNFSFGNDVAISADGSVVAVGSPTYQWPVSTVHIYRRTGESWALDGPVLDEGAGYGRSVALSDDGTVLAVGSGVAGGGVLYIYRHDVSAGWVLEWDSTTWSIDEGIFSEGLATSVDLDAAGGRVIVGAPYHYAAGVVTNSGGARIFAYDGTTWVHEALFPNPDPLGGEFLGEHVTLDGDTAVVGGRNDGDIAYGVGSAYVYEWDGTTWSQSWQLTPTPAVCDYQCGHGSDVDLLGDRLLVRTQGLLYQDAGDARAEAASLYRRGEAGEDPWVFVTRIFADQPVVNLTSGFAGSCALAGERVIIGSPGDRGISNLQNSGVVRVYDINECQESAVIDGVGGDLAPAWQPIGCGTVSPDGDGLRLEAGYDCELVGAMADRGQALFCGDFDVRVGWCFESWPSPLALGSQRGVYLAVNRANNDDHGNTLAAVGRVEGWASDNVCFTTTGQYHGWFNTIGALSFNPWNYPDPCSTTLGMGPEPTAATSGAFRITRVDALVTLYYREDADWVSLGSRDIDDTSVSLQVWASSSGIPGQGYSDPAPFAVRIGHPNSPCAPTDTEPPVVTITAPVDMSVDSAASTTLTADVVDESATTVDSNPVGVAPGSLGAGGGTVSGGVPLAEGPNVLMVNAVDEHGLLGGSSVTVYLDSVAPTLGVAPADGAVLGMGPVGLMVAVTDQTETDVTVDAVPAGTLLVAGGDVYGLVDGSLMNFQALGEGPTTFSITATDAAGNATTVERTIVLDSTAPVVTIDDPLNGEAFDATPIPLVATVDDDTVVAVSGDLTDVVPAGGGIVSGTADLVEGWNDLTVTGTDAAANSSSASVSVLLDTTPPSVAIVSPLDGALVRDIVDYHAVAADDPSPSSGVEGVELLLDGAPHEAFVAGPYESQLDTRLIADGWHELTAVATDGVGHEVLHQISIRVDNTPPIVSILDPAPGALLAGDLQFSASAQDDESGLASIAMRSGGNVPAVADGSTTYATPVASDMRTSIDLAPATDGAWTLSASAVDAAGNSAQAAVTVYTDNSAPEKAILSPADGAVVGGVVPIEVAVADANLDYFELLVDGVLLASETGGALVHLYDTTLRADGPMAITVVAHDTLGNSGTCSITVTVDNTGGCVEIHPETLNLKSKGKNKSITVKVCGYGLEALLPTEDADLRLCVPGGNPVPSTADFSGDDQVQAGDGEGPGELLLKFDRQKLIASIRAGRQSGAITGNKVVITLKAGSQVLGSDDMKLVGE